MESLWFVGSRVGSRPFVRNRTSVRGQQEYRTEWSKRLWLTGSVIHVKLTRDWGTLICVVLLLHYSSNVWWLSELYQNAIRPELFEGDIFKIYNCYTYTYAIQSKTIFLQTNQHTTVQVLYTSTVVCWFVCKKKFVVPKVGWARIKLSEHRLHRRHGSRAPGGLQSSLTVSSSAASQRLA